MQLPHVDPGPLGSGAALQETVLEEPFIDHIVVDLVDYVRKIIVLPEESEELGRGSIDCHESRVHVLLRQHVLEYLPSASGSLS